MEKLEWDGLRFSHGKQVMGIPIEAGQARVDEYLRMVPQRKASVTMLPTVHGLRV